MRIGGYATITVVRTGGAAGPISAHYATGDGTAMNGVNYTGVNGTVAIGVGTEQRQFHRSDSE